MTDESNVNKYMGGYDDADQFTRVPPPAPKSSYRANSGRVDPHLTHYVGTEAARELRALFDDIIKDHENYDFAEMTALLILYRRRLNDLLGLQE